MVRSVGLFFAAKELSPAQAPPVVVQVGVPLTMALESEPTKDGLAGDRYFAVVTQVRAEGPPKDLGEVRTQVIADLKRLAAMKSLQDSADALAVQARELSLDDVVASIKATGAKPGEVRRKVYVSRSAGVQAQDAGVTEEHFAEAVMSKAEQLDPAQPIDPRDPRLTFGVAMPKQFAVAVVQITTFDPLTQEAFRASAIRARNEQLKQELRGVMDEPYTLPALAKRYGVELKKTED